MRYWDRLLLLATTGLAYEPAGMASAQAVPWTQEIYVWQRQTGPAVNAALDAVKPLASGFNVLAAEVAWSGGLPHVSRFAPDYAALAKLGRPVGLSLRIWTFPGPFAADDTNAKILTTLAASLLAEARAAGLEVRELQIDFDCAEAKLAGYQVWLSALHAAVGQTSLIFTALPVWLSHEADFAALARTADGFVLQVHSLEKPTAPDVPITLCDPVRALAWAAAAGRVGAPFRVALPTYGYRMAFDVVGKFFALAAEGPTPTWPANTQVRVARADAVAMAGLAHMLEKSPPPHCTGILWFRLPIEGDQLNWDKVTLNVILRGEAPAAQLALAVEWPEPGLAEIVVVNSGTTTEPLPTRATLRWPTAERLLAADGLGGFRLAPQNGQAQMEIAATAVSPSAFLAPGHRVKIAWLRFTHEIAFESTLQLAAP